ncbi:MAG TPA: alkaline phosphatase D family protein [Candidatus Saccharimonadales bacterium]|nr:alkaline phosphatase D family protein [Candidatus Saccharimonadales bacterium]
MAIQVLNGASDLTTYMSPPSGGGVNVTTIPLDKPANTADGDLLVAEVTFQNANGTPSITPPSGWTRVGPAVATSPLRPSGIYVFPVPSAAAVSETSWTWSTNVSAGRARGMIFRVTGADLTTPLDAQGVWSAGDGTTSLVLPEVVAATNNAMLLAIGFSQTAAGNGYPTYTPPGGMTTIATVNNTPDTNANTALWAGYQVVNSGATGTRTISLSPAVASSGGYMVTIKEANAPPVATLVHNISGVVTDNGFQVAFKSSNVATGVRIVASLVSDLSSPIYSSSVMPDGDGYGHANISGLTADTQYYWALELDGALDSSYHGKTRTLPTTGARASFSFAAGSCVNTGDDPVTFDNIRARMGLDSVGARFFAHLGDFHYVYSSGGGNPIAPEDQAVLRENYSSQIAVARQHQLFREIPLSYSWSDIDSFGSNGDGTYAANNEANAAYRQVFPVPSDMPVTSGIYRTWVIGRVRFIQSDMRTFASAIAATDNVSKTKLGSAQKTWLLNLVDTSTESLIVWLGDSAWFGAASTGGGNDGWSAYNTERTEIGNAIAASGKNFIYIHGDSHTLAADDGTNNQWGGFPIACAAPMSRPDMNPWPTGSGWTVSQGSYPSSQQAGTAYGWFDITDNGTDISLDFSGYNANVEQISMTVTWPVIRMQRGDGTPLKLYTRVGGNLTELA